MWAPACQEHLDAGGEPPGVARVSPDDVVKGRAGVIRVAAVRVGAVIEKPLQRFRFQILARREENGEPAPAESVNVGTVTHQEFHHWNAAGLCHTLERNVFNEDLAQFGIRGEESLYAGEVIPVDG